MAEIKAEDILNMISALQRLEIGDLDRLVRIRNKVLDGDLHPDDIDYVYNEFGRIQNLRRDDMKLSSKKSSHLWYLLPIFLSVFGGLVAYMFLRRADSAKAKKTLLLGSATFTMFLIFIAIGVMYDTDDSLNYTMGPDCLECEEQKVDPLSNVTLDRAVEDTILEDNLDQVSKNENELSAENIVKNDVGHLTNKDTKDVVEPIRQHETHTISYDDIPSYANSDLAITALEQAMACLGVFKC